MSLLTSNNIKLLIAAPIGVSDTTIEVVSATGLPDVSDPADWTIVTLIRKASNEYEIVKLTSVSGTTLTIERSQENTTALTFSGGDALRNYFTSGMFDEYRMTQKGTYSGATAYTYNDVVSYNGSSYVATGSTTGNLPTDTNYWSLLAQAGDMVKATYDPTNIASDSFDMDNMVEGANTKILTAAERTDLGKATLNDDTDVSSNSWVLDEDTLVSDSPTKVPTQQSVKAYVDANVGAGGGGILPTTDSTDLTSAHTVVSGDINETHPIGSATTADFDITLDVSLLATTSDTIGFKNESAYIARIVVSNTGTMTINSQYTDRYLSAGQTLVLQGDTSTNCLMVAGA